MTRPLRLEFPGAVWHVTNRGVEQRDIYLDDDDHLLFEQLLSEVVPKFRWRLPVYTQMTNHFHLVIETVEPTLSRGMQSLQKEFAEAFNAKYRRAGHLFGGRFKSHLVESETYLLEVARYLVLNPVRARMVSDPASWRWSSYRATAGLTAPAAWLDCTMLLDRFDEWDQAMARQLYAQFVAEGHDAPSPWEKLVGGMYLGSEAFLERVQSMLSSRELSREHVERQRVVRCATIDDVERTLRGVWDECRGRFATRDFRTALALLLRDEALATLQTIGELLGVGATGASYLVRKGQARVATEAEFKKVIVEARDRLRNCRLQM